MNPAYHIPLDDDSKQLIGEICAIQGQIEWTMQNSVRELLKVDQETALRIMGSTSIGTNAEIWINLIRRKQRLKGVLDHAEQAFKEIRDLAEGRNDFIHAVYFSRHGEQDLLTIYMSSPDFAEPPPGIAVAMRVRNRKQISVDNLLVVRETAAVISVRVAHAHWMTTVFRKTGSPSPWRDRLAALPPLPTPKKAPQRAKARRNPPRASQG